VKLAVIAGLIYATTTVAADARCHKYWYYPWPQSCGAARGVYARATHPRVGVRFVLPPASDSVPVRGIPIPDMSAQWGGTMDTELELSLQRLKAIRLLTQ
jgi:hypothetical protein